MKNPNLLTIATVALLCFLSFQSAHAQTLTKSQADSLKNTRAQNVYFELLGAGLTFSANYDTRFQSRRDGIGARIGIGYFNIAGFSLVSVPFEFNYLLGKNSKFFEIGAGATYLSSGNQSFLSISNSETNGSTVFGTITMGYRYQPIEGGFNFRAGANVLFNNNNFLPYYGVSFGFTF